MSDTTLYRAFQASVRRHADVIAIRDEGLDLTYRALEQESRVAGRALLALGLKAQERAAVWSVNRLEWVIAGLGIQAANATLVPLGTRLKGPEVAPILRRARVRVVFCDPGVGDYDFVKALEREDLPGVETIVVFGEGPAEGRVIGWRSFLARGAGGDDQALEARIAATTPEDLADILFTSGTTGTPKGVPMTHAQSIVACEQQQLCCTNFVPGDIFAVAFPFAHNAGYRAGWNASLLYGVRIIPVRAYDGPSMVNLIERERVSVLPAAPPIFQGILDDPSLPDRVLSCLRFASTGATTIPVKLITDMRLKLGAQQVATGYGLTEAAGSVTNTRPGDSDEVVAFTTGRRLENLDVMCVDAEHKPVPVGQAGEVAVRGFQVMRGYYEDPDATAKSFTTDGFLLTGDVGVFDAAGNLKITDRLKDMYIVGGFNCYPAEIEQNLRTIPGIREVAVVGIEDSRLGQVGRAFVVRAPDAALDEAAIIAWSRANMANYKVPRQVTFVDALPLNAMGKVNKVELRTRA